MRFLTFAILPLAAMLAACDGEVGGCPSDSYCPEQRMVYTFNDGAQLLQDSDNWYQLYDFNDGTKDWYAVTAPDEKFMEGVKDMAEQEVMIDGMDGTPHTTQAMEKRIAEADAQAALYEESYEYEE